MLTKSLITVAALSAGYVLKQTLVRNVSLTKPTDFPSFDQDKPHFYVSFAQKSSANKDVSVIKSALKAKMSHVSKITDLEFRFKIAQDLAFFIENSDKRYTVTIQKDIDKSLKAWNKIVKRDDSHLREARAPERFQDSLFDSFFIQSPLHSRMLESEKSEFILTDDVDKLLYAFTKIINCMVLNNGSNGDESFYQQIISVLLQLLDFVQSKESYSDALLLVSSGKILCSLTLNDISRTLLANNFKFVALIARWAHSDVASLSLIGRKCLWNLSNPSRIIPDGVYVMEKLDNSSSEPVLDVVWFHGLGGSVFYTWRQGGPRQEKFTTCWPLDWLWKDLDLNCRFVFVDYETLVSDGSYGSKNNAENIVESQGAQVLQKLYQVDVGRNRATLFIGHSMGGLVMKQALLLDKQNANNANYSLFDSLHGLLFLSTPHFGSPIAKKFSNLPSKWFKASPTLSQLGDYSKLFLLNFEFMKHLMSAHEIDCISICESLPSYFGFGVSLIVVPLMSAYPGFGSFRVLKTDHLGMSKAKSREDPVYEVVKDFVKSHVPSVAHGTFDGDFDKLSNRMFEFFSLDY